MDMEEVTNANLTNSTLAESSMKDDLKPIFDYLMLAILIVVMLAMGCEVTWMSIWVHVKKPTGLLIGLVSQFGVKPLCSYLILLACGIKGLHATGVLIIACCPGGVLSNTFSYFCDGDLGLSVAMTTASTVMAMGLMPANLLLYGRSFESDALMIPYAEMAFSLISVTSPVIVGMILKWKLPTVAKIVTKVGSFLGVLIMFTCIAIELIVFPDMFDNVPLILYGLVVLLPVLGLVLGYGLAYLARQNVSVCKTVAIECGIQNVLVALTIIAMSFPIEMQADIVLLPWLYGFVMIIGCSAICLVYYYCKKRKERLEGNKTNETDVKENGDVEEKEDLIESNDVKVELKPMQENGRNGKVQ